MTVTFKRNLDPSLPASHVFELKLLSDVDSRNITNVPGILLKDNPQARGAPLSGLSVKVTDGFFLDGISAVPVDQARNLKLLAGRRWFDIPIVYANRRRAILAIDKGETGQEIFKALLTAWGQYPDLTQPETDTSEALKSTIPEEWKRTMVGQPKAR
jgi:hypothetical protein